MFTLLYWISRGFTEGWKWADKIPSSAAYHLWRLIEVIAIFGIVLFTPTIWVFLAQNLIGMFIYERINMYVDQRKWFKEPGAIFDIGLKIPRYKWQDYLLLLLGIGIWVSQIL